MKSRTVIMGVAICAVALLATFEYSGAATAAGGSSSKIGVVSVRTVFNKSQQQVQYRTQALAQQGRARTQLEDLSKEVQGAEAELKTLKEGTADFLKQMQSVIEKRAQLEGRQEYLKQQRLLEDKLWMERLYQETLKVVATLAQEKGLELVLERTEPNFPISSDELMATFSTHKVLYAGGSVDLTDEVISRLDSLKLQP